MTSVSDAAAATLRTLCPTSSSALSQHRCVRVLWLSLAACVHMVAAPARAALTSSSPVGVHKNSSSSSSTTTTTARASSSVPRTANSSFAQPHGSSSSNSSVNASALAAAALCGLDTVADGCNWLYNDDEDDDEEDDKDDDGDVYNLTRSCSLRSGYEVRLRCAVEQLLQQQQQQPSSRATSSSSNSSSATNTMSTVAAGGERAVLQLSIHDVMASSKWEKLDAHRALAAVIVVVNAAPATAAAAAAAAAAAGGSDAAVEARVAMARSAAMAEVVHTVFDAHFADCLRRCIVVGASRELQATLQLRYGGEFVCVAHDVPVTRVARGLVEELTQRIAAQLYRTLQSLQPPPPPSSSLPNSSSSSSAVVVVDASMVYTPLDKQQIRSSAATTTASNKSGASGGHMDAASAVAALTTAATSGLRRSALASRLAKKRGDVLLQLGACDAALRAYGDTHFASGVDPLWCSATLESIAAVRYEQLRGVLAAVPRMNALLLRLQSDAARHDEHSAGGNSSNSTATTSTTATTPAAAAAMYDSQLLTQMERALLQLPEQLSRTLAVCVRGASVPRSMRQRLQHDVYEPLNEHVTQLRGLLPRVRAALQQRTRASAAATATTTMHDNDDDDDDGSADRAARELKQCVEAVLRLALREVDVYLRESLRQLRKVPHNSTGALLRDRELERQLKLLTYCVDRGDGVAFAHEHAATRAALLLPPPPQQQQQHAPLSSSSSLLPSTGMCDVTAVHRVLVYLVALCVCCGRRRSAVAGLVELGTGMVCHGGGSGSSDDGGGGGVAGIRIRPATALRMLLRACVLGGVDVDALQPRDKDAHAACDDDNDSSSSCCCTDPLLRLSALLQRSGPAMPRSSAAAAATAPMSATASALDLSATFALPEHASGRAMMTTATAAAATTTTATTSSPAAQLHPDHGTNRYAEQQQRARTLHTHVALLRALLDVLHATAHSSSPVVFDDTDNNKQQRRRQKHRAAAAAMSCVRVACLLLCRYDDYLSRTTQQALLRTIASVTTQQQQQQQQQQQRPHGAAAHTAITATTTSSVPFLLRWEALPLPPHLAPKTISLGGPFFTFIDTQRLRLTVLCLHGRRLRSRVVWAVGDAGAVRLTLYNPLRCTMTVASMSLCCTHVDDDDDDEGGGGNDERNTASEKTTTARHDAVAAAVADDTDVASSSDGGTTMQQMRDDTEWRRRRRARWLRLAGETASRQPRSDTTRAPLCYTLTDTTLAPYEKMPVLLKVTPRAPGSVRIDGVELSFAQRTSSLLCEDEQQQQSSPSPSPLLTLRASLPEPMTIPVLPRLPLVCCTLQRSEVEMFARQRVHVVLRLVNSGHVPVTLLTLTAHSEACQLDDCEGCRERASRRDVWVVLDKAALAPAALSRRALQPGDALYVTGVLHAPWTIARAEAHAVLFRVDAALPHTRPTMPPQVPTAVPVFGVIPRRTAQTPLRVFYAPGVVVVSVTSSRDRRYAHVRVANRSTRYSVELQLAALSFAATTPLPSAFLVAGAEYVVPPLELARIAAHTTNNNSNNNNNNNNNSSGSSHSLCFAVPWVVRELTDCCGVLDIDFGSVARDMVVCAELLDDCLLSADVHVVPEDNNINSNNYSEGGSEAAAVAALSSLRARVWHWESRVATGASLSSSPSTSTMWSCVAVPDAHHATTLQGKQQQQQQQRVTATSADDDNDSGVASVPPPHRRQYTDQWGGTSSDTDEDVVVTDGNNDNDNNAKNGSSNSAACVPASHMVLPLLTPVRVRVRVMALPWRRALTLRVRVVASSAHAHAGATASDESHYTNKKDDKDDNEDDDDHDDDEAVLVSGMTDCRALVGAHGSAHYEGELEVVALTAGVHALVFVITDDYEREVTHTLRFLVESAAATTRSVA